MRLVRLAGLFGGTPTPYPGSADAHGVTAPAAVVADLDGQAIGHTTVSGNELVHLFVDPDHWGGGLGRALLDIGEELLTAAGHREAELHTIVGNEPALVLYRSAGWVVTDRLVHNDWDGVAYDEHVLVERLPTDERR